MRFIGLAGRAQVGKTTTANAIAKACHARGIRCVVVPFAAPVKRIAYAMQWDGNKDAKGRRLLQLIGTECGRECVGPDVWVRLWADSIGSLDLPDDAVVVADDVRFGNERDAILSRGGVVFGVERRQPGDWWRGWLRRLFPWLVHVSERPLSCVGTFRNDGTLADVDSFAARLVDHLVAKKNADAP